VGRTQSCLILRLVIHMITIVLEGVKITFPTTTRTDIQIRPAVMLEASLLFDRCGMNVEPLVPLLLRISITKRWTTPAQWPSQLFCGLSLPLRTETQHLAVDQHVGSWHLSIHLSGKCRHATPS
jgi:hypothetical protein